MQNVTKIQTKSGPMFRGEDIGKRGGVKAWYCAAAESQTSPGSRALWCETQREAAESAGAANIGHCI